MNPVRHRVPQPPRFEFTINPSLQDDPTWPFGPYLNAAGTLDVEYRFEWKWADEPDSAYRDGQPGYGANNINLPRREHFITAEAGRSLVIRVQSQAARAGETTFGPWGNAGVEGAWYTNSSAPVCPIPSVVVPDGPSAPVGASHYTFGQRNVWLDVLADDRNRHSQVCVDADGDTSDWCAGTETDMGLRVASSTPGSAAATAGWSHSSTTRDRLGLAWSTTAGWGPADSVVFRYCVTFTTDIQEQCASETLIHGGITAPRNLHQGSSLGHDFFTACWFVPEKNGHPDAGDIRYELQVQLGGTWRPASSSYFDAYNATSLTSTVCDNGARVDTGGAAGPISWRVRAINDFGASSPWATASANLGPRPLWCISDPVIAQGPNGVAVATFTSSASPADEPTGSSHSVTLSWSGPSREFTASKSSPGTWSVAEKGSMSNADFAALLSTIGSSTTPATLSWGAQYGSYDLPSHTANLTGTVSNGTLAFTRSSGTTLRHPLYDDYDAATNTCSGPPEPVTPALPVIPHPPHIPPPVDLPVPQGGYFVPDNI